MKPHVYTYNDPNNQRVAYRGYVKQYDGSPTVTIHNCAKVHYNKAKALADAKKLIIQLKKTVCTPPLSKQPMKRNSALRTAYPVQS